MSALADECETMLAIPQDQRSAQHGDTFYKAVLAQQTQLDEAVRLLGEVADWCGTSDWSGPQLPHDVARRMAVALNKGSVPMHEGDKL